MYSEKIKPEQLAVSLDCIIFHLLSVLSILCCGTRTGIGTEGTATFCLNRTGTVMHSGSSSKSEFDPDLHPDPT